ncbi:MAG: hypothetical protein Q8P67_07660 [archaeon]|nr:hypothetical protein [archaeon]
MGILSLIKVQLVLSMSRITRSLLVSIGLRLPRDASPLPSSLLRTTRWTTPKQSNSRVMSTPPTPS